jgi:hypothetical protein
MTDRDSLASALPSRRGADITGLAEGLTPAVADAWEDNALSAIDDVETPEAGEDLLARVRLAADAMRLAKLGEERERRWGALRLKAERRYGELLPPKQPGKRTDMEPVRAAHRSTPAERTAQKEARKVAAVPAERFDGYVNSATKPSRAGLLASKPRKRGKRQPNWDGKTNAGRERELKRQRRGNYSDLLQLQMRLNQICRTLEGTRVDDYDLDAATHELVDALYDDLVTTAEWIDRAISAIQARVGEAQVREKIAKLRNTSGRSPAEAEAALRLADVLERKLQARLPR